MGIGDKQTNVIADAIMELRGFRVAHGLNMTDHSPDSWTEYTLDKMAEMGYWPQSRLLQMMMPEGQVTPDCDSEVFK